MSIPDISERPFVGYPLIHAESVIQSAEVDYFYVEERIKRKSLRNLHAKVITPGRFMRSTSD